VSDRKQLTTRKKEKQKKIKEAWKMTFPPGLVCRIKSLKRAISPAQDRWENDRAQTNP